MKRGSISCFLFAQIAAIACKQQIIWLLVVSLLVLFSLFFVHKSKNILIIAGLFFCLFYLYTPSLQQQNHRINQPIHTEFTVSEKGNNYYLVKNKQARFIIYISDEFEVGDRLYIRGQVASIKGYAIPNLTNFAHYLQYKRVFQQIKIEEIVKLSSFNFRSFLKKSAYARLSATSRDFIQLIVFNDKLAKLDFYDDVKTLSIVQLFVISGFHIHILHAFLQKISKKRIAISFLILLFYLYIINFSVSALRAFFMLLLGTFLKKYKISSFQVLLITTIILLCINPLYLFMLSFQLSVVASLALVINKPHRHAIFRPFLTSLQVYVFILPFLINLNHEVVVFSFLYNALLMLPVSIMYIGAWVTAIFKITDVFYMGLVVSFESLLAFFKSFNVTIIIGHLSLFLILVYYLVIIAQIYFKKIALNKQSYMTLSCLVLLFFLFYWGPSLYSPASITFLDVGQGDATIIKGKNNEFCILIDTGGNWYTDISLQRTIPYLKSLGIRSIDLVIITHDDYDHAGALDSLVSNFNVKQVQKENFTMYEHNQLRIINLNAYQDLEKDANYNSLVLHVSYLTQSYLIMGDAPKEIEYQIIENEEILEIDVLRIGHHGSHTSTSHEFLQHVQPKQAIISVGKDNVYGHPHFDVIKTLEAEKIPYFRTDLDGSIVVKKKNSIKNIVYLLYNRIVVRR